MMDPSLPVDQPYCISGFFLVSAAIGPLLQHRLILPRLPLRVVTKSAR